MKKKVEQEFIDAIRSSLEERGFSFLRREYLFFKPSSSGAVGVSVWLNATSRKASYKIVLNAHIDLAGEAEVLGEVDRFKKHLLPFLININCDNLWPDPDLASDLKVTSDELEGGVHLTLSSLASEVFPFLQRYSNRDVLISNLSEQSFEKRITSDPMARLRVLLAAAVLDDRPDDFEAYSKELRTFSNSAPHLKPQVDGLLRRLEEWRAGHADA